MKAYQTLITVCLLLSAGCIKTEDDAPVKPERQLGVILQNNYAFSMFYSALQRTGLDTVTVSQEQYTLLAPDNDAFILSGIDKDSLQRMNDAALKQLIGYHIIKGNYPFSSLPQTIDFPFTSLEGTVLYASVPMAPNSWDPLTIHFNGLNVKKMDILAANGVIHAMERVLRYPAPTVKQWLENAPRYSRFTASLKKFGLLDRLAGPGPFVVLALPNEVYDRYGIDDAALENIDTTAYKKLLFNNYTLSPRRFFWSDLSDAPISQYGSGVMPPVFLQPDAVLEYTFEGFRVFPYNYKELQQLGWWEYGEPVKNSDTDYPALNGVVHGVSGVLVYPDSARIN
ncbi:fasciclin domain-containing protein [Chitinophaga sp. 22620]|uniref:fasciclin domain-containing protein n=1 Tax=Chitinophaga sp. 22620 TaxID=3453952 RepID=UPI003F836CBC